MFDFLARRLGHRGAFLGLFGLIWLLVGASLLPDPSRRLPGPDHALLFTHIPLPLRLAMWGVPGLVALICAWLRGPGRDTLGFALLIIPPIVRGGSYGWAWLLWLWPPTRSLGDDRGWIGAVVWAALAGAILIISSWREPAGFAPPAEGGDDSGGR